VVHAELSPSRHFTKTARLSRPPGVYFEVFFYLQRRDPVPSGHAIQTWVRNFEETGSAFKKKPPGGIRSVRTPESIAGVRIVPDGVHSVLNVGMHCR
jgi:hypothetical protein